MTPDTLVTRLLQEAAARVDVDADIGVGSAYAAIVRGGSQAAAAPLAPAAAEAGGVARRVRVIRDSRTAPAARDLAVSHGGRRWALGAAACIVVAAACAAALVFVRAGGSTHREASWQAPRPVPVGAPAPGELLPEVDDPPPWLGEVLPAYRDGGARTGTWVSLALGRQVTGGYDAPIMVSAVDGTWRALDDAADVVIDGLPYRAATFGSVEILARAGSPTTIATGTVDRSVLADVLAGTSAQLADGTPNLRVDAMPPGYSVIVAPTVLAADPPSRRALASAGGQVSINEVSDIVDPLLAAVGSGSSIRRVDVGGRAGWTGVSNAHATPLTFLVWSPQPGVVFEIDSTADTAGQLLDLARRTTAVPRTAWEQTHPG